MQHAHVRMLEATGQQSESELAEPLALVGWGPLPTHSSLDVKERAPSNIWLMIHPLRYAFLTRVYRWPPSLYGGICAHWPEGSYGALYYE